VRDGVSGIADGRHEHYRQGWDLGRRLPWSLPKATRYGFMKIVLKQYLEG
jgi:hypothetical protein